MSTKLFHEQAAAKVNLTLEVLGRRADGYHELKSLVAFTADCSDQVTLEIGAPVEVVITGDHGAAIVGTNILHTTLSMLSGIEQGLRLGRVLLDKRLPVAAGIGGGSADAAALLRAVARANADRAGSPDWYAFAARLGSDVPVCLASTPSLVEGIGERLTSIRLPAPIEVVLANPLAAVPADKTARVFRAFGLAAGTSSRPGRQTTPLISGRDELVEMIRSVGNDLTHAARTVMPVVDEVLQALAGSNGCLLAQLSGAGPTGFGVYHDRAAAENAADALSAEHPNWWVRAATLST